MLMLSFGGANRDPDVFEHPDVFDITRDNSNLLMFGFGAHYCLGVHLAKAELRASVDAMCDFLPTGADICADVMEFRPMGMFERPTEFPSKLLRRLADRRAALADPGAARARRERRRVPESALSSARMNSTALFCMSRACCSMKRSTIGPAPKILTRASRENVSSVLSPSRARAMRPSIWVLLAMVPGVMVKVVVVVAGS